MTVLISHVRPGQFPAILGIQNVQDFTQAGNPLNPKARSRPLSNVLPLVYFSGSADACQALLEAGAPVEATDKDGLTGIHLQLK